MPDQTDPNAPQGASPADDPASTAGFLTVAQAAAALRLPTETVARAVDNGNLSGVRSNKRPLVARRSVDMFLAARRVALGADGSPAAA